MGQDLHAELKDSQHLLSEALTKLKERGKAFAKSERDYRIALQQEILRQRDNGIPVTIISDICRGQPDIAQLKFDRDVAESLYDSAKEAINVYKLQVRTIENQIEREWKS